ncbi:response regulator [Inquilinus limosus]|uniref:response regulator transcription factor n=1 Tax=Inquilinus limosus TaxID=171674 RepID=UPI003F135059
MAVAERSEKASMPSGEQTTRVLVIEDHELMRLGLISELSSLLKDCVIHGAGTIESAKPLLRAHEFDLVVIDPGLPGFDPTSRSHRLTVVKEVVEATPQAIHIVVTGSDRLDESEQCRRLGANGYVGKVGLDRDVLDRVLREIAETGFATVLSHVKHKAPEFHYSRLTPREQEIIDFMRQRPQGVTRKEIYAAMGDRFGIDPQSVEKYYKQARAKLFKIGYYPKGT